MNKTSFIERSLYWLAALGKTLSPWQGSVGDSRTRQEIARQSKSPVIRALRNIVDYALIWPLVGAHLIVSSAYKSGKDFFHRLTNDILPSLGRWCDKRLITRIPKILLEGIWNASYLPFKYAVVNTARHAPPWLAFGLVPLALAMTPLAWTYMPYWGFGMLQSATAVLAQASLATTPGILALAKGIGMGWAAIIIPKYAKAACALVPIIAGPAASRFPRQVLDGATKVLGVFDKDLALAFQRKVEAIETRFRGEYSHVKYTKFLPFVQRVQSRLRLARRQFAHKGEAYADRQPLHPDLEMRAFPFRHTDTPKAQERYERESLRRSGASEPFLSAVAEPKPMPPLRFTFGVQREELVTASSPQPARVFT